MGVKKLTWQDRPSIDQLAKVTASGIAPGSCEFSRRGNTLILAYRDTAGNSVTLLECVVVREGACTVE